LPSVEGFEVGRVYEPGSGAMAGDFYDVYQTADTRTAVVIGDVSGHGIEPSITAFQVKYLLRVFLREYRDPAQALEELNALMSAQGRPEDFVSLVAAVFDTAAGTLRYASAGHPPAILVSGSGDAASEARPLQSFGPCIGIAPTVRYQEQQCALHSPARLFVFSDGTYEVSQQDGSMMAYSAFTELLAQPVREGKSELDGLLDHVREVHGPGALEDDFTIIKMAL
jgi:serine phosphatase RsbU (regulator of sigma subunit)